MQGGWHAPTCERRKEEVATIGCSCVSILLLAAWSLSSLLLSHAPSVAFFLSLSFFSHSDLDPIVSNDDRAAVIRKRMTELSAPQRLVLPSKGRQVNFSLLIFISIYHTFFTYISFSLSKQRIIFISFAI